jgi:NAD+ kinase
MKRKVGILAHQDKPEALQLAAEVVSWMEAHQVEAWLDPETAARIGRPAQAFTEAMLHALEFLVTLGGDGTILKAARMTAPLGLPILGVHLGRFGFIAEAHPSDLYLQFSAILDGENRIEERMMVAAEVYRDGVCLRRGIGLNEAVVKSGVSHLLRLKTRLRGEDFATYPADGIIVATPTGSTAYALSAGGPLVEPTVQALLLTPICPHTLSARPMVVPSEEVIEIQIASEGGDRIFALDGVDPLALQDHDTVVVRRADCVTRLIVLEQATFYHKVRARYLYGERLNE